MAAKKFTELLVQDKVIGLDQLEEAQKKQIASGESLAAVLVSLGYMTEAEAASYLAQQFDLQPIDLESFEIAEDVLKLIPKEICMKHTVIPVMKSLGTIVVACSDPSDLFVRDNLSFLTKSRVEMVVSTRTAIQNLITRYHGKVDFGRIVTDLEAEGEGAPDGSHSTEYIDDQTDIDAPVIKFVNTMIKEAIKNRASDIHLEPYENRFRVRFRIDGILYEKVQPPAGIATAIASRIKIMSRLDISERRRPQDGRLQVAVRSGQKVDFRVSILPTLFGEKIVMRLLDKSKLKLDLGELGFENHDRVLFEEAIALPQGMLLITGPTGSGKSTTIYSALNALNKTDVNISTAEDPVEFNLEGINQVQVNPDIDVTFSTALRSFLRQDPDIIFVGEIRDQETAEIAFKAAATGHLVVSTLHTNDAPATVARLIDIGIAPYMVVSTLSLIVAQRLMGRVCSSCKQVEATTSAVLEKLGIPPSEGVGLTVYKGKGCQACNGSGISGRVAVHEVMKMTTGIKLAVLRGATIREIREVAIQDGMISLRQNAITKMKKGLTTIEEVAGITMDEG